MFVIVVAVLRPALVARIAQPRRRRPRHRPRALPCSVAFGFYVVNQYLRGQDAREELHRLARRIAVVEAAERYGLHEGPAPRTRPPARPRAGDTCDDRSD